MPIVHFWSELLNISGYRIYTQYT